MSIVKGSGGYVSVSTELLPTAAYSMFVGVKLTAVAGSYSQFLHYFTDGTANIDLAVWNGPLRHHQSQQFNANALEAGNAVVDTWEYAVGTSAGQGSAPILYTARETVTAGGNAGTFTHSASARLEVLNDALVGDKVGVIALYDAALTAADAAHLLAGGDPTDLPSATVPVEVWLDRVGVVKDGSNNLTSWTGINGTVLSPTGTVTVDDADQVPVAYTPANTGYYLQSSSTSTGHVVMDNMAQGVGGGATRISWDIEIECKRDAAATDFIPFARQTDSTKILFFKSDDSIELRVNGQTFTTTSATHGVNLDEFHVYKLEHREVNTTYETKLYVDGTLVDTYTLSNADGWLIPDYLFGLGSSTRYGAIKYFKYTDNITAANSRHYDATASGGVGTVLPETTGNGSDGTQAGTWPSDFSEWVSYNIAQPASISLTGDLSPGTAFTVNYSDFVAAPVSPVTLTDSQGNAITVAVTVSDTDTGGVHSGTADGTMPALPSSGSAAGLLFGTVTVELSS